MIIDSMAQPNLRMLSNCSSCGTRIAATEHVRIEMLHCPPDATVLWRMPEATLGLMWVRDRSGSMRVLSNGHPLHNLSVGQADLWFFPEGLDVEGELVSRSATNCIALYVVSSFVPAQVKIELTQPIVGFSNCALGRSFSAFAGQFAEPDGLQPMYIDGWAIQMLAHVRRAARMGGARRRSCASGLAPWQLRRAKQMLLADISDSLPLSELAAACRLSVSQFARAFRASAGVPPHQWLIAARLDNARELLAQSETPLVTIATMCGFADQSHFSRVFARVNGITPGAWRREHRLELCTCQSGSGAAGPPRSKSMSAETEQRCI